MVADSLAKELEFFEKNLSSLMKDEGKYALILGDELLGIFGTYEDALNAGYKKAQLKPFLVKKITGPQTVAYFSRDIDQWDLIRWRGAVKSAILGKRGR